MTPAQATVTTTAPSPSGPDARHVPGEAGVWVLILGDMVVFAIFFATYLVYRAADTAQFAASQAQLNQTYGAVNTLLLLTSSLLVAAGVKALRTRNGTLAPWLFSAALACGLGFAGMKFLEYGEKIGAGLTPRTDDFFMLYYILTGVHFFHVVLGMGVLTALIVSARRRANAPMRFVEGGACFWHMVDLLWIILFPLLYLVR